MTENVSIINILSFVEKSLLQIHYYKSTCCIILNTVKVGIKHQSINLITIIGCTFTI